MAFIHTIVSALFGSPATLPLLLCAYFALRNIYRHFFHPLSHIPGPLLARISSLYLYTLCYLGTECHSLAELHSKYGASVIRVAPNAVSVSDGAALHPIYVAGGGFKKDKRYKNFDLEGHQTIFSTLDLAYRDLRAKAVLPLFAMGRVRASGGDGGVIRTSVDQFVKLFASEKRKALARKPDSARLDILDLATRLTIDVTTGYLFNRRYGGLDEQSLPSTQNDSGQHNELSAAPFIHTIVAFGKFSLLPNWAFQTVMTFFMGLGRLFPDKVFNDSRAHIDDFVTRIVRDAVPDKDDTYQSRLLAAGISRVETMAQCKAVTFAGTDSTSIKLATLIFHLVQNPCVRQRLMQEFRLHGGDATTTDPQTLPYLRAVVQEGLRIGMANPAGLTRTVPANGLDVGGTFIPPGISVGMSAWTLHHNPELFPEPYAFRPERWLDEGKEANEETKRLRRLRDRDVFPFGVGARMCIARNLATHELFVAVRAIAESGLLEGARTCGERIELDGWFNVGIRGHKLEVEW